MVETSSIIDYFYQKGYINDRKSHNYVELFHNLVIQLINNEKYEELIILCYDVYSFKDNLPLIQKLIFTLINLHANKGAVDLCELCLKNSQEDEIFYEAINDFLKYDNYSGIIDLCRMYIRIKPNGNLSFIRTVILGFLKRGIKYFKIYNLIGELLELNRGVKYIYTIIYSMLEIQNYEAVINICKLILQSNSKEKLNLLNIINLLIDNGKYKEAWELCKIL
ncbi:MAG: hypothetical protein ACFFDF_20420, partial [Candidatus Odinarchaeota archaeon]